MTSPENERRYIFDERLVSTRDKVTLLRMLSWMHHELQDLGAQKSAEHVFRTIECLKHEI